MLKPAKRSLAVSVACALLGGAQGALGANAASSDPADYVIVELNSPAAARYEGGIKGLAAPRTRGRFDVSSSAYAAYRKHLDAEHGSFRAALARAASGAQAIRDYRITANAVAVQLNGADASVVARVSGVRKVYPVALYRPAMNQSVGLIDLDDTWAPAREAAGDGVRVGVIDSGILTDWDETTPNPFFACKPGKLEFGGVFFSGVTGAPALAVGDLPVPSPGALFVEPHGTHVAGTVGGCVTTISDGSIWNGVELSGVAPGATLVDYNVFPGIGAGYVAQDGSAFSHDIAAAIETSVGNGDHVINMSLSGAVQGPHDFLAEVSEGAVAAGVVVVAATGNSGESDDEEDEDGVEYSVGSPASAASVIGVGATTTTRGLRIAIKGDTDGDGEFDDLTIDAFAGDFDLFDGSEYEIIDWPGSDNLGCANDVADDSLSGAVVLIQRGVCAFSEKIQNAKQAGASGVIVYANSDEIISMSRTDGFDDDIPAVFIAQEDGETLEADAPLQAIITGYEQYPTDPNLLADFSSRGPVPFTGIIKPDVVAPGVNILSSTFTGFELYDGTSMATPHVAGASALLLDAHPDWTPAQVKSALATTAMDLGLKPWQQGSGLIQVDKAAATNAFFTPTNASFGIFRGKAPANGSVAIAIALDTAPSCAVGSISGEEGGVNVDASIIGTTLTVSFDAGRTAPGGLYGGMVTVNCGAQTHTIPWAAVVDR